MLCYLCADRVKTLKAEMEASGQKLDSFNYGCVMKAYGQNGRVEDLLALWDEIKDKEKAGQLDVDSYLYTITIGSLGRNGQIKEMLNLWHEMKARSRSVEGYVCTHSRTTSHTFDTKV
jgi:pentatricopeptide repeat protein